MAGESSVVHIPSTAAPLPPDWRWDRLDEVCDGVFDCPHSTPLLTEDGPFVVRSQDMRTGVFHMEEAGHVSEDTYQERIVRAEPRYGDLLYSREGTYFGIAAEVPARVRVCLGQRMVLLRPKTSKCNHRFLRYWLNSPVMASHTHGHRDGTVAERLNLPTIRQLPVPVPPLAEQRAIAHILGPLDDKIELNRQMNETLEAMARALFKSWFVDFDPVLAKSEGCDPGLPRYIADLFPDSFEDSELGEIPKGWQCSTIGKNFKLTMGQSPPGSTYNESGDGLPFFQGRTDFGFRYPSRRVFCTAPTRLAKVGDTLVSVRAPVGDVNIAIEPCAVGRGVAAVRHLSGSRSFTYHAMHNLGEHFDKFEAEGTVFGSINKADFERLPFVVPPQAVLDCFEHLASPIDDRIESNESESRTLVALRDTLLPRLISGELRVKAANDFIQEATA